MVTTPGGVAAPSMLSIRGDGTVMVAGVAKNSSNDDIVQLSHYKTDGVLDPTGIVKVALPTGFSIHSDKAVLIDTNGRILVVGTLRAK
jgi:hypothetical protein